VSDPGRATVHQLNFLTDIILTEIHDNTRFLSLGLLPQFLDELP
jgi:hypothetical protein